MLEFDVLWVYVARQQGFNGLHRFGLGQFRKQIPQIGIRLQPVALGGLD